MEFPNVTALAQANLYFEGKVVSHAILLATGEKKTLGVIFPGEYYFGTDAAERMEITAGQCLVRLEGSQDTRTYGPGEAFVVPAKAGFTITVSDEPCQYVCSYLAD